MATQHVHSHDRHAHKGMPKMPDWLSVEQALEYILGYVNILEPEEKPLLEALGQVLAGDVHAPIDVPGAANSSMDGYAVQWESIAAASPTQGAGVRVTGQLAAGQVPSIAVHAGEAIRIMTGALIPPGADTVVPFEETDELEQAKHGQGRPTTVKVLAKLPKGANIRLAGEDIRQGELVLKQGTILRPSELGVLASLGTDRVRVIRKPAIGILSTGDEILEPGEPAAPGKIFNSNSYSIAASVLKYGGIPKVLGVARDNLPSLEAKIREGLSCDMLVTTAGVSRGDYDIVKDVLMRHGEIAFWTVRMRPAKPLAFGALTAPGGRRVPHLGLPGNPVSSLVAFEEFGRPAIYKMLGKSVFQKPTIRAILEEPIVNSDERRVYARAIVTKRGGQYYARLTGNQSSGALTSMAKANGLAICPEDVPVKNAGETVEVQMLDWTEEQS